MDSPEDVRTIALAIDAEIRALSVPSVANVRAIRHRFTVKLHDATGDSVLTLVRELHHVLGHRWVALELLLYHEPAFSLISASHLDEFADGLDSWNSVDAFAVLLAGPAWLRKQVPDTVLHQWANSTDRWRRRAALASTVVLNTPSRGGKGDVGQLFDVAGNDIHGKNSDTVWRNVLSRYKGVRFRK